MLNVWIIINLLLGGIELTRREIPTECYTRIVGYFRPVQNWGDGKKEEYFDRKTFSEQKSLESQVPYRKRKIPFDKEYLIFGRKMCSGCQSKKQEFEEKQYDYEYVSLDDTKNIEYLKQIKPDMSSVVLPVVFRLIDNEYMELIE